MNKNGILVYDSGIGGINVLITLKNKFRFFDYFYLSDSKNSPYGTKDSETLFKIAERNLESVGVENYLAVVLACNTLSTNCLERLKKRFSGVKFIGVFPNVEVAKRKNTLLLCTEQTASSSFVLSAQKRFPKLVVEPTQKLVCEVEKNVFSLENLNVKQYVQNACFSFECVLLGCTHFCFLKENLARIFPESMFFDGSEGTIDHFKEFVTTHNPKKIKSSEISFKNFILNDRMRNFSIYNYLVEKMSFPFK